MKNRIVVFLRDRRHTIVYKFVILYSLNNSFMIRNSGKRKTKCMVEIKKKIGRKEIESYLPEDFFTKKKYLSDLIVNEVIDKIRGIEEPKFSEIPYIRIFMYDLNNKVTAYTYKNV